MSDTVFVSRGDDDGSLEISVGGARIIVSELRVRPMSNSSTPHQAMGKGGASIALTDEQFMQLVAQYMRFMIGQFVIEKDELPSYSFEDTGFEFHAKKKM